jgi:hypothetical protein
MPPFLTRRLWSGEKFERRQISRCARKAGWFLIPSFAVMGKEITGDERAEPAHAAAPPPTP